MLRLLIVFLPIFLFAHKVNLFLDLENGNLFINSYYSNGKACVNCNFKIEDESGKLIFEDILNKEGEYNYKTDLEKLKVTIDAGAGHQAQQFIEAQKQDEKQEELGGDDEELKALKEENRALKVKIKLLEEQLNYFELFKVILGLFAIFLIFFFIKRVKT